MKVLIAGGAGDMSKAIGERLKRLSYQVFMPDRKQMNVTDIKIVKNNVKVFKPDIIIYGAGYINPHSIKNTEISSFIHHFNINVYGLLYCLKAGIENECKTFINIGSTSAFEGRENWSAYCASKASALSLMESLAKEGYKSYSIHPARTDTKMRKKLFPNEDKSTLMPTSRIADFVEKCLNNEFSNGSHIIIKKNYYYVIPMRKSLQ